MTMKGLTVKAAFAAAQSMSENELTELIGKLNMKEIRTSWFRGYISRREDCRVTIDKERGRVCVFLPSYASTTYCKVTYYNMGV